MSKNKPFSRYARSNDLAPYDTENLGIGDYVDMIRHPCRSARGIITAVGPADTIDILPRYYIECIDKRHSAWYYEYEITLLSEATGKDNESDTGA
jgi:hypothetical protein